MDFSAIKSFAGDFNQSAVVKKLGVTNARMHRSAAY
jgi:hypothetical protein